MKLNYLQVNLDKLYKSNLNIKFNFGIIIYNHKI